ncbi:MAG: SMC-Scp complex subunit ScpB [Candidatus Bathyarchaeota archaeon]|nr:SMC-Scp complex subunit ScpB [Candidatus Bathyarchaeota archaeon]
MQETKEQVASSKAEDKSAQESEKTQRCLKLLEAALYVAGRPLSLTELSSVLNTRSQQKTKKYVKTLMQDYSSRSTALEILELKDERYVLQLKAEFTPLVKKLVNKPLLSSGPLKTLAYIAYRQPVTQKRVIQVRGQHAYSHIKLLKEMGLVATERSARSMTLRTTDYFADYFGLSHDVSTMKRELKRIFGETGQDAEPFKDESGAESTKRDI